MAPAPWESISARDTVFVLVTGANSGVGLGICERLIDTFLATHPLSSHLVVLPTTRSARKSAETVAQLRKHLARAAPSRAPAAAAARVHVAPVQLDLCDLASVRRAADRLVCGTVALEGLGDVRIPRLDAVVFNAGVGGWTGVSWPAFAWDILTRGWVEATTRPYAKRSVAGLTVNPLPNSKTATTTTTKDDDDDTTTTTAPPSLGLVFCANVFGHYLLAHHLIPLLSRGEGDQDDGLPPGRIIWQSSVDPQLSHFSPDDLQGLGSTTAYESSKMLTDILCLTADLNGVRARSAPFFSSVPPPTPTAPATAASAAAAAAARRRKKPNVYLAHPGIVATTMFPLHFALMWGYILGTLISRWLGSPWHPVYPYSGAAATVWLALAGQEELDGQNATRVKWGSATDWWGNTMVKKTEVDAWGWEGKVEREEDWRREDATLVRALRKGVGRRRNAQPLTEEKRAEFEELGARCWTEMEKLRGEWEARLNSMSDKGDL